jgi:hypothetical protein
MLTYRTEAREVSLAARHLSWIALVQFKITDEDLASNGLGCGMNMIGEIPEDEGLGSSRGPVSPAAILSHKSRETESSRKGRFSVRGFFLGKKNPLLNGQKGAVAVFSLREDRP